MERTRYRPVVPLLYPITATSLGSDGQSSLIGSLSPANSAMSSTLQRSGKFCSADIFFAVCSLALELMMNLASLDSHSAPSSYSETVHCSSLPFFQGVQLYSWLDLLTHLTTWKWRLLQIQYESQKNCHLNRDLLSFPHCWTVTLTLIVLYNIEYCSSWLPMTHGYQWHTQITYKFHCWLRQKCICLFESTSGEFISSRRVISSE